MRVLSAAEWALFGLDVDSAYAVARQHRDIGRRIRD